ncbi:winged helix-turn-helix domain-containing protein [Streptomyces sp. NBC_01613]|uniref:winged helix-turn-helix domain-containing protein n=1 Tax=Streptomyces sp. NBC_01613 TaxID=2975896 RepID=UPI003865E89E
MDSGPGQRVIARSFRIDCSMATVWRLLHRRECPWQIPARQPLERDEHAVGVGRRMCGRRRNDCGGAGAFLFFEDQARFLTAPPPADTGPAWTQPPRYG